ncbi:MAG: tyrosine--tRNA ligase [Candidatus Nanoarchaeia archaeon]|nr:tyrosine--tRNA ligase [Candidatus Nanoarchaeia archaeon]
MDIDLRIKLVEEVGEEIITKEELKDLLKKKKTPIAYDGFEPSGQIHIAQAILRAININKMTKAGFKFKMLVADWHAWANNKLDGDLKKIQTVGEYFIEVWKASGMDLKNVEFIWASDLVKDDNYWKIVMEVARHNTLQRIIRTSQIMGRSEKDVLHASQILYPCMQAADIFYLKADACQLGMDQRKVNVLAREVADKLGYAKPIIVSHHMLMGLSEPPAGNIDAVERAIAMKMSKSNPDSAIFVSDSEDEIINKIKKAYCPEKKIEDNPILEYCKYLVFERFDKIEIKRPEKFGGNITITSYLDLEKRYAKGEIHPLDLKNTLTNYINEMIKPIREHFKKSKKAQKLYDTVKNYKVTR